MKLLPTIAAMVLTLAAIEGAAYWWMHPTRADLGQPVLVYRPEGAGRDQRVRPIGVGGEESAGQGTRDRGQQEPGEDLDSTDPRSLPTDHLPSTITPLPELVARSIHSLHCSTGTAARIDRDDGVTVHVAFFEWDFVDSTNVLEASDILTRRESG